MPILRYPNLSLKPCEINIFDLGLVDFSRAWQQQKKIFDQVKSAELTAALIVCRHYPAITLGRQGKKTNLRISEEELKGRGISIYQLERAGDITYHGPGQLVAYPVFNLEYFNKDIHLFLRRLEEVLIGVLAAFNICARRITGLTGAWVGNKKIASIGIAIRNWITFHGLALNIEAGDLDNFSLIKPCGMDIEMTAMEKVSGNKVAMAKVQEILCDKFKEAFSSNTRRKE